MPSSFIMITMQLFQILLYPSHMVSNTPSQYQPQASNSRLRVIWTCQLPGVCRAGGWGGGMLMYLLDRYITEYFFVWFEYSFDHRVLHFPRFYREEKLQFLICDCRIYFIVISWEQAILLRAFP